jgi:hypothetical protein
MKRRSEISSFKSGDFGETKPSSKVGERPERYRRKNRSNIDSSDRENIERDRLI